MPKTWLCWVRRFDMKLEPQIVREFIPASLKPQIARQYELSPEDATLTVAALAARFPAPEASA